MKGGRESEAMKLEEIYALYVQDVYRYIFSLCRNKELTQDIVQETFYRAFLYLESYNDEKIKPWLFKVAYHTFIDLIRKEKKLAYVEDMETLNKKVSEAAEDTAMNRHRIKEWLALIEGLPLHKKNLILLRDYYQFSCEEIADMLGMSIPNVKVSLFRIRKELRAKMKGSEKDEV
ncbi:sigma-70 family RNA polymerase sigma factor [Ureibacillus sp. FSL K6-8385]|uniref:Sigma-70 family RNA polymerase sigma factor n=1 Tax=Ureibacillus terrenus TaxID=118246 RepID=A0A540V5I8_9BACL|nr:sigma-70 family RNA polymerase sigma factor [Ureibacillus terrenus]MED3661238.1 sigma-70 family RNA polymerase sigma factor [Ureibacillus terrenus]MED3764287.1 sigma-70 family RNA polymerase sigma factor [Ureibacillus terrenus]TQE92027.1 sigma-70 family RNA polymerase sigma factor [Ureibacillus terrenus]